MVTIEELSLNEPDMAKNVPDSNTTVPVDAPETPESPQKSREKEPSEEHAASDQGRIERADEVYMVLKYLNKE